MPHTLSDAVPSFPTSRARPRTPLFKSSKAKPSSSLHGHWRRAARAGRLSEAESLGFLALAWAWLLVIPANLLAWAVFPHVKVELDLLNQSVMLVSLLGALFSLWGLLRAPYREGSLLMWLCRLGALSGLLQLLPTLKSLSSSL